MSVIFFLFRTFITNLKLAQETAMKKGKSIEVIWRGYKDSVAPSDPKFTVAVLRSRLLLALRYILRKKNLTRFGDKEQNVIFSFLN